MEQSGVRRLFIEALDAWAQYDRQVVMGMADASTLAERDRKVDAFLGAVYAPVCLTTT